MVEKKRKLVHEQKKKSEKFSKGRLSWEKAWALRLNFLGASLSLLLSAEDYRLINFLSLNGGERKRLYMLRMWT